MPEREEVISGVKLRKKDPTTLSFRQLFTWTIWQFPRQRYGGLVGAVHPPDGDHGWFPAIIHVKEKRAQVYGHLEESFATPEAAMEHFGKSK